jgi:hypothetical protein
MPLAVDADLNNVSPEVIGASVQFVHFAAVRDASPVGRKTSSEHVRDKNQFGVFTNRAINSRKVGKEFRGSDELGMRIADLMLRKSTAAILVNEMLPGQPVINDCGAPAAQLRCRETFARTGHCWARQLPSIASVNHMRFAG